MTGTAEDRWQDIDRRSAHPDEIKARYSYRDSDPLAALCDPGQVALIFFQALQDPVTYRTALLNLTTPESWPLWGDFSGAADYFAAIENVGLGSQPVPAVGAPDVVYIAILRGVPGAFQLTADQILHGTGVITLVWRPEVETWLIHSIGDYAKPEHVPRTAV